MEYRPEIHIKFEIEYRFENVLNNRFDVEFEFNLLCMPEGCKLKPELFGAGFDTHSLE